VLGAPDVYLQRGLLHVHAPDSFIQGVVKEFAAVFYLFVVDPVIQNIIEKNILRNPSAPRGVLPQEKAEIHIAQIEGKIVVPQVGGRHGAVKKLHGGPPAALAAVQPRKDFPAAQPQSGLRFEELPVNGVL